MVISDIGEESIIFHKLTLSLYYI